jgi:hypothetical protein
MTRFFSLFLVLLLMAMTISAQAVTKNDPVPANMAKMKELRERFANAGPINEDELVVGKSWNCTSTHYYLSAIKEVWTFDALGGEVTIVDDEYNRKFTFTEKGLVAKFVIPGWEEYNYVNGIRKIEEGLIMESSLNPTVRPYQFVSATDEGYFTWAYFICNPAEEL